MSHTSKRDNLQAAGLAAASIRATMQGLQDAGMLTSGLQHALEKLAATHEKVCAGYQIKEHDLEQAIFVQPPQTID